MHENMKKMKIWAAVILAAIAFPLCATAEAGDLRLGLRIPVGVYGWTPLDDWADTIAGAAGIRTGAEVFPLGGGRGYSDRGFFLSGRACAGYRLGLGDKNTYNARLHSLTAEFVLLARLNFTRQQGLYLGCGPLWEMDIMTYDEKYGETKSLVRRGAALNAVAGYEFRLREKLAVFVEANYAHFFLSDVFDFVAPTLGLTIGI